MGIVLFIWKEWKQYDDKAKWNTCQNDNDIYMCFHELFNCGFKVWLYCQRKNREHLIITPCIWSWQCHKSTSIQFDSHFSNPCFQFGHQNNVKIVILSVQSRFRYSVLSVWWNKKKPYNCLKTRLHLIINKR